MQFKNISIVAALAAISSASYAPPPTYGESTPVPEPYVPAPESSYVAVPSSTYEPIVPTSTEVAVPVYSSESPVYESSSEAPIPAPTYAPTTSECPAAYTSTVYVTVSVSSCDSPVEPSTYVPVEPSSTPVAYPSVPVYPTSGPAPYPIPGTVSSYLPTGTGVHPTPAPYDSNSAASINGNFLMAAVAAIMATVALF